MTELGIRGRQALLMKGRRVAEMGLGARRAERVVTAGGYFWVSITVARLRLLLLTS